jgi:hypothetical protein
MIILTTRPPKVSTPINSQGSPPILPEHIIAFMDYKRFTKSMVIKTGCLNACLMNAEDSALMEAMRIDNYETLKRYTAAARTLKATLEAQGVPFTHLIDTWRFVVLFLIT